MGSAVLDGASQSKGQKDSFEVEKQKLNNQYSGGGGEVSEGEFQKHITLLVSPTEIKGQLLNSLLSRVLF